MSSFKPGDTVVLNSGSPLMTVERILEDDTLGSSAVCVWFEKGESRTETFVQAMLRHSKPTSGMVRVVRG